MTRLPEGGFWRRPISRLSKERVCGSDPWVHAFKLSLGLGYVLRKFSMLKFPEVTSAAYIPAGTYTSTNNSSH